MRWPPAEPPVTQRKSGSPPCSSACSRHHAMAFLQSTRCSGKPDLGREPVVGVDADPTVGGQVVEQRDALLALVADHPAAAVDLQDARASVARLGAVGLGDVEPQSHGLAVAEGPLAERDVADGGDARRGAASGTGRSPGRAGSGDGEWSGSSSMAPSASARWRLVLRGGGDDAGEPSRGREQESQADPAGRLVEPTVGHQGDADDDLPEQPPRRQLDGEPGGEEARHQEQPVPAGGEGVERVEGAHDPDDEEGSAHVVQSGSSLPRSDAPSEPVLVSARGVQHRGHLRAGRRPHARPDGAHLRRPAPHLRRARRSGPTGSPTTWRPRA